MRSFGTTLRGLVAAGTLVGATGIALAQDYTVNAVTDQWIDVPTTATDLGLNGDDISKGLKDLPFPIAYFGKQYTQMSVSTNGFVQFAGGTASGCCSPSAGPLSGSYDGICSIAWTDLYGPSGGTNNIYYWVQGTAPNRRLIITWNDYSL